MSLKRFISFTTPLIIMLFTYTLYISINKIVNNYENSINNDYSIIIVSTSPLIYSNIKKIRNINIKDIKHIKRENILKGLQKNISTGTYELLQKRLPYFYTIHLNKFPTTSKLEKIKKRLQKVSGIKRVETFSKNHDHIYSLLLLIKTIISTLFICIFIFTILIMLNNVKIWFYEHSNRLSIIKLHGGSIYYGAKPIIRIAIISSIVSSLIIVLSVYLFSQNLNILLNKEVTDLINNNLYSYSNIEIFFMFLLSFLISIITVFGILVKHRLK